MRHDGTRTLNFAHRGARQVAPENTLAAFGRAVDLGADGIELDTLLSQDGVLVVCHNLEQRQWPRPRSTAGCAA